MRKLVAVSALWLLLGGATVRAANPADEVRRAEIAFAKAFADRDQAAFFAVVLDDASFLSATGTLAGKRQVVERWSRFFAGPKAPFSWGPERVVVNAAGTIGLSTGPVFGADGKHVGNYASVWVRQAGGSWKVLFDGPGSPAACLAGTESAKEEGFVTAGDGVRLHFRKAGEGPFTLIVPQEAEVFDAFAQLTDVATVIAYEPRGRGRSEKAKDGAAPTAQQDAGDLEAVRQHFAVERFVPVGISNLAPMVARYAVEHPEHVTRVVLIGPAPEEAGAAVSGPVLTIRVAREGSASDRGGRAGALSSPEARLVTVAGGAGPAWVSDPVGVFGSIREYLRGGWPLGAEKVE